MTMQIRTQGPSAAGPLAARAAERGTPLRDLGKALRAGDLAAASKAYATVAAKAPERIARNPDGPFSRLGAALAKGDLAAARSAYASVFSSHLPQRDGDPGPTAPAAGSPVVSATRTGPGALLDVSA